MDSFFSSLKTERTARKTYRPRSEADVFDYIERFYNPKRPHQGRGMNGRTPITVFKAGLPKPTPTKKEKSPPQKPDNQLAA